METIGTLNLIVPAAGAFLVLAFAALARVMAKNYIKVPPNQVAIFYGRWRETTAGERVGFRVVTGGSKFKASYANNLIHIA